MARIKLFVITCALALTGAVQTAAQNTAQQHGAHRHDDQAASCCKMAAHKSGDKEAAAPACCAHKGGAGCCGDSCRIEQEKASWQDATAESAEHKGDCCGATACADKAHKHVKADASADASLHGAEKMSCCAAEASCCADGADCCKAHKHEAAKAGVKPSSASAGEDKAHAGCCAHGSSCCQAHVARR